MNSSSASLPSCQLRNNSTHRPSSRTMEDGGQETLIHAMSLGLRRSRYSLSANGEGRPKIPLSSSPFLPSPSSQEYHHDMRITSSNEEVRRRTQMANILDAALNIAEEIHFDRVRQPQLNSQASLSSVDTTESDETESSQ